MLERQVSNAKYAWIGLLFGPCLLLAGTASATNGYITGGYSVSQRAMGGAGTAMVEDATEASINPANMVWVDDRFDSNLTELFVRRGYLATARGSGAMDGIFTVDPADQESHRGRFYIPGVSYKRHIDEVSSAGIALYANGGLNSTYTNGTATFAQNTPLLQAQCNGAFGGGAPIGGTNLLGLCGNSKSSLAVDLEQIFLVPSYSHQIGEHSSIGLAPILVAQQVTVSGLAAFAKFSNDPVNVSDKGYSRSYGGGFRVGALTTPIDWLSLGASYQLRSHMTTFKRYAGLFADKGAFDVPETWNVGLAFAPAHNQKIAIDYQRINFHQIKSLGNRLDGNEFVNDCALPRLFGMTAPSPYCLGGDSGPGFGWRNVSVMKVGYQVRFSDFIFRLGYGYGKSPVQSDQALFSILVPALVEREFTGGISYKFSEKLTIDTAVVYEPQCTITGQNPLSNTSADLVALAAAGLLPGGKALTANAFGPDPNDQNIRVHLQGVEVTMGLSYHF